MTTTATKTLRDGLGVTFNQVVELDASSNVIPHVALDAGGAPVSGSNPLYTAAKTVTYGAVSGNLTLAAGGTAQNAQGAGTTPVTVVLLNPSTATEQGTATAETIWVSAAGAAQAGSGGGSFPLEPGQSMAFGPTTQAISWVAASTGHKICGHVLT